jgi:hypothetical protein
MILQICIISFLSFANGSGIGDVFLDKASFEEEDGPTRGSPAKLVIVIGILYATYFFGHYGVQDIEEHDKDFEQRYQVLYKKYRY